ncbi:hypothetical protein [Nonomuraea roseoviolacea]|uniref:Uncharacterized protein n=1 Tax=Nonomuraea roseoviolacea subsp. carminata TaxID=160689 RepID=A0ABT1KDC1_9ACTN|nr:hypothetical protein [Nonomuraea roseoviolacea]MCP2351955.1 hypothetical protein [Nonomuraea roseoviolacea subsp. carminata]
MPDLVGGHGRRAFQSLAAGAGGGQALVGAFRDEFADELGRRGDDSEDHTRDSRRAL